MEGKETSETAPGPGGPTWWGELELPVGQMATWCLGPLCVVIRHRQREWRIAWWHGEDPGDSRRSRSERRVEDAPDGEFPAPEGATILRFAAGEKSDPTLRVAARLADRPIVARPKIPFYVMPGEEGSLFLGTPLWVEISRPRGGVLVDVPVHRLSDSWFGPSTIEGELCYSTAMAARLNPENQEHRPDKAVTEVKLVNRAADPLRLERLALPVPNLKLYADPSTGDLWTQPVTVERRSDGESARVTIGRRPAKLAEAEKLADPRRRESTNVLDRALSALLR